MIVDPTIPRFTPDQARTIACEHFGVTAESAQPLVAYSDQNFRLRRGSGRDLVLKISNAEETEENLDFQNRALRHAARHQRTLEVARVRATASGKRITAVRAVTGQRHLVRLLTFVPGRMLAEVERPAPGILRELGRSLALLDRALATFDHPAAHRQAAWDPRNGSLLWAYTRYLTDDERRRLVESFLGRFESRTVPLLKGLRRAVIHNDGNPHNVLVEKTRDGDVRIAGIIDFGDIVHSHTVCEPAVAAAYAMLGAESPLAAAAAVVGGYHEGLPLTEDEIRVLLDLICVRLCVSVTFGAFHQARDPDNEYLAVCAVPAWQVLESLAEISAREAHQAFSEAVCGRA